MREEIKKTIEFYLKNINTEEYIEYKSKSYEESKKVHQEYIKKEKPHWKDRNDFYEDYHVVKIVFGDVLSNDGVVKLLKKNCTVFLKINLRLRITTKNHHLKINMTIFIYNIQVQHWEDFQR